VDVYLGCVLPYHAYVGMSHIFTDYLPKWTPAAWVVAGVMFLGLQRLNYQGEGISATVRRTFSGKAIKNEKEKEKVKEKEKPKEKSKEKPKEKEKEKHH